MNLQIATWPCFVLALTTLASSERPPNIVVLMADDLGIGDIGCFGNDTIQTPHIDSIAKQGVKFTQHLSAAALCTPSRSAFLTGRLPIRMGLGATTNLRVYLFLSSAGGLQPEEVTIAETLKQQGYTSGFIGKWHLGLSGSIVGANEYHPLNQGFDYFYGVPLTNIKDFGDDPNEKVLLDRQPNFYRNIYTIAATGLLTLVFCRRFLGLSRGMFWLLVIIGMTVFSYVWVNFTHLKFFNSMIMRNYEVVEQPITYENMTQKLVHEGVEFMTNRTKDDKPFFLVMSWLQVHTVLYNSVPGFRGRSKHGEYGDNVEEMDWSVGQILDAIDKLGFKDNTLVYFSSDHGGHLEERGPKGEVTGGYNGIYKGGKGQGGYDGSIRVPTVAMWPGRIRPGSVIDTPTSQMDFHPTVAKLAGAKMPTDGIRDGKDISPTLLKGKKEQENRFFAHYCGNLLHAVRYYTPKDGKVWKAHYITPNWIPGTSMCTYIACNCWGAGVTYHDTPVLYEITSDPAEDKPLDPHLPEHKAIIQKLEDLVKEHKASIKPVTNQMSYTKTIPLPWLQPGCNFPFFKCTDKKFAPK